MTKYKITIEIETQTKLEARSLNKACRNLEEDFFVGSKGKQEIKADWKQGFYFKKGKQKYFMEGKNEKQVGRQFKQIIGDNLSKNSRTTKKLGGKNASF